MKARKTAVALVLLLVLGPVSPTPTAGACSIAMSLWDLIGSADAVVVARVVSLGRGASPQEVSAFTGVDAHDTATLEVIDAWKGTPPPELQVDLFDGAQRGYVVGEVVLAFLVEGTAMAQRLRIAQAQIEAEEEAEAEAGVDGMTAGEWSEPPSWSPEERARALEKAAADVRHFEEWVDGRWIENGLSEDARSRTNDLESLEDFVRAAARLHATGTDTHQEGHTGWVVSALERPGMRDALVIDMAELSTSKESLTDADLQRIARVFADAPSVGYADLPMLKLLASYPDPAVDAAAASVVEAALRMDPIPDWAPPMVSAALARYGDHFVERIGRDDRDRQGRLIEESSGRGTLPAIWAAARRDLGIPEVAPAEPRPALPTHSLE